MTNLRTARLLTELQKTNPSFNLKYKDQSLLMKIISCILFFNKGFMTNFITTIGNTVYFTSQSDVEKNDIGSSIVLSHEFVHSMDAKKNIFFKFLYLIPQILTPIFIILFFILPSVFNFISLGFGIICLLPLPAPWRTKYELRGYQMSLFAESEMAKEANYSADDYDYLLTSCAKTFNDNFTGAFYYWMDRSGVMSEFNETITRIKTDDIVKDDSNYSIVREALKNSK